MRTNNMIPALAVFSTAFVITNILYAIGVSAIAYYIIWIAAFAAIQIMILLLGIKITENQVKIAALIKELPH